jgi:hypothetical protein
MNIHSLLQQDELLPANCFMYSMATGLTPGIALSKDAERGPCVETGGWRVFFEKTRGPFYHKNGESACVRRAVVEIIEPRDGKPFPVLARPEGDSASVLILLNTSTNGVRLKDERVRPWHGWSGNAEVVSRGGDEVLMRLHGSQHIFVMCVDGRVVKLSYKDGSVKVTTLPPEEAANFRVEHARKQLELAEHDHNVSKKAGILFGMISLLPLTLQSRGARDRLVEFLKRNDLTDSMRGKIRAHLSELGDERAASGWFADREAHRDFAQEPKGLSAEKLKKRNERREEDAARRLRMKGTGGGGGGGSAKKGGGKKKRK